MVFLQYGFMILACLGVIGCTHVHSVVTVDANGGDERIRTKFRYRVMKKVLGSTVDALFENFEKWQPDVFDKAGMPVVIEDRIETSRTKSWYWTWAFSAMSLWTLPVIEVIHLHETCPFTIVYADDLNTSVRMCGHAVSAFANNPVPLLVSCWGATVCVPAGKTFSEHSYQGIMQNANVDVDLKKRALAYALAVRLKELEDSGRINDTLVSLVMSKQNIAEISWAQKMRVESDERRRILNGLKSDVKRESSCPFEIVEMRSETGRDFAYQFVLSQKGTMSLADYNAVRRTFRDTIVAQYAMKHPEVNPRALVVDFVEYAASQGRVEGKVVVLNLTAESIVYDPVTRKGRMSVRIGANQLEEARRWMRKHIGDLAAQSNICIAGGKIPEGARFYSGNEKLREDGLLEVEFKTE